jgi:hypothetical protein
MTVVKANNESTKNHTDDLKKYSRSHHYLWNATMYSLFTNIRSLSIIYLIFLGSGKKLVHGLLNGSDNTNELLLHQLDLEIIKKISESTSDNYKENYVNGEHVGTHYFIKHENHSLFKDLYRINKDEIFITITPFDNFQDLRIKLNGIENRIQKLINSYTKSIYHGKKNVIVAMSDTLPLDDDPEKNKISNYVQYIPPTITSPVIRDITLHN